LQECVARLNQHRHARTGRAEGDLHASEVGKAIQQTLRDLPKLSDAIAAAYFAHSAISRTGREPNYKFQLTIFMRQKIQFSFLLIVLIGFFLARVARWLPVFVLWITALQTQNCVA